jgi:hypothetical protein
MASNVRHSSESPKWGTAPEVIDIALKTFGYISVDPFSEPEFNAHVGAERILTGEKGLNGFKDRWLAIDECPRADWLLTGIAAPPCAVAMTVLPTALVNPPGDDQGLNTKRAWFVLNALHRLGWLAGGAIWVGFSLNQLQTLQLKDDVTGWKRDGFRSPLHPDFVRCIPDHRLGYTAHSTSKALDDAPSHPSFFVLLPSTNQALADVQRRVFAKHAGALGEVF